MGRRIPIEDFFRNVEKTYLKFSPDGRYLAWMEPWRKRLNVFVMELETGEVTRVTCEEDQDLWYYLWGNSERIVYFNDSGGDENLRLYGVRADGSGHIDYTPYEGVKCDWVDPLPGDDRHFLFCMNRRDPREFDVHRLDLETGEHTLVQRNPGNVSRWITDHDGRLRLAHVSDGLNTRILYRSEEAEPWREIGSYDFRESALPLMFTADNGKIHVSTNLGRDKRVIAVLDPETGAEENVLFEHPEVDVENLLYSRKLQAPVGARYTTEKIAVKWFDEKRRGLQEFVDGKLPGYTNLLLAHDEDERFFAVYSAGDRTRGSYHLLRVDPPVLEKLFDVSPWLQEKELAPMEPISYTARDGFEIPGYLTLPPGKEPVNLPAVIHPHGGPWHRDGWGFRPEVQFLANRGYAVLQMNFRGSTGYGRKFLEAGYGEWGLSMQDDITDGVRWLIDKGIADPKRIAIYGGSYGGYAALMGIVKDPDLYAACVDFVGVSNLFTILENMPPYWEHKREMMYERIGHPERDRQRLMETSPALNADRMRTPLFIAQGANDPRVRRVESDQVVEALRRRGVAVKYMVKDDEGHGFFKEENKFEFHREMEQFLEEHLGS